MADTRRLTVNPNPLRVVTARPGGPAPKRGHVLAVKLVRAGLNECGTGRVSVHRDGCPRIPFAEGWAVKKATSDEISQLLDKVDGVETVQVSISCRTCGGWSSLP